ncbi:MAG: hypothetical protein AB1413_02945 [Thermodesulfobacteriota bacterium]
MSSPFFARILFFPEGERFLYEMAPLINCLAETPGIEVHLLDSGEPFRLCAQPDPQTADQISDRVVVHRRPEPPRAGQRWLGRYERVASRIAGRHADWLLNSLPSVLLLACFDIVDLLAAKRQARAVVARLDPHGLILARDRHVGLSYALLARMRALGRFTCLAPWGFVNTSFLVANRAHDRRNQLHGPQVSIIQRLMAWRGSRHIFTAGGIRYSYFKPGRTLACLFCGLYPSNPWFFGSDVDLCLVDSHLVAEALVAGGVPRCNLRVTGNQIHDILCLPEEERRSRRTSLSRKYGCRRELLLIVALPHLAEHRLLDWPAHWAEMEYILATLADAANADVLISLHPRCDRASYEPLAQRLGLRILDEALKYALPVADLFVCQWSGTTTWAVSLGVPTVVLDWYGISSMGLEYLEDFVVRVGSRDGLAAAVRSLNVATKMGVGSRPPGFPPIDGQSTTRVRAAILDGIRFQMEQQPGPAA